MAFADSKEHFSKGWESFGDAGDESAAPAQKAATPISAHPVFPFIVALWFAALLGLGSMVMPTILIERIISAIGLPAILPAAGPPLGFKAHLMIGLTAGFTGGVVGFLIARRIGKGHSAASEYSAPRPADTQPDRADYAERYEQPVKRPISALEELGAEGLDEPVREEFTPPEEAAANHEPAKAAARVAGRRRALAVTDEDAKSDFLFEAPLAGGEEVLRGGFDPAFAGPAPLELNEFDTEDDDFEDEDELGDMSVEALLTRHKLNTETPEAEPAEHAAVADSAESPFADLQREVTSLNEQSTFKEPAPETGPELAPKFDTPLQDTAVGSVTDRKLGDLGMVELVERFALALESHQKAVEADQVSAASANAQPLELPSFSAAGKAASDPTASTSFADDSAEEPSPEIAARRVPKFLQPVNPDADQSTANDGEDDDLNLDFPVSAVLAPEADTSDEQVEEADNFAALLAMKSQLATGQKFVRVDDPGQQEEPEAVVVFPHEEAAPEPSPSAAFAAATQAQTAQQRAAPHKPAATGSTRYSKPHMQVDPGETEQALRDALAKLQRMSGAA